MRRGVPVVPPSLPLAPASGSEEVMNEVGKLEQLK